MNTDQTYCTGEQCLLRSKCKRYVSRKSIIPNGDPLWWTQPFYDERYDFCPNFLKKDK